MKWSRLFPREWRDEFGADFDATVAMSDPDWKSVLDIVVAAARAHEPLSLILAWCGAAWLNVAAAEVQWAAGWLVLSCAVLAATGPRSAVGKSLLVFTAIPLSSAVWHVSPGHQIHETLVALIPCAVGCLVGFAMAPLFEGRRAKGA
ncbi:MAG: hypothetical protein JSS65_02545 [Armatimonadetes bacterium]|nr:hypothetical protein [Armatimonadota bacterium]